jgi:hypothetical protein
MRLDGDLMKLTGKYWDLKGLTGDFMGFLPGSSPVR